MSETTTKVPTALVAIASRFDAIKRGIKRNARWLFSRSQWLANAYYLLFSGAFGREHRAVLEGNYRYETLDRRADANRYLLRRNTHRLEKGLLMRPRRDLFALGYIEQTVEAYERCAAAGMGTGPHQGDMRWAHDVLAEYFAVTASHVLLDRLRPRFSAVPEPGVAPTTPSRPYLRDLSEPVVDYDTFYKLTKRRRSVRWFLPTPVPRELLDKAVVAASESPSACNRQPFHFRIFDDPELVRVVSEMPMGTRGFAHNFPAIVVVVGEQRAYFHARDRHLIYIDGSLASMSFMLALETLGLSSCPINWPDIPAREKRMAEFLKLDGDQRPIMLIAVGYADPEGAVAYSQKLPPEAIRVYNHR